MIGGRFCFRALRQIKLAEPRLFETDELLGLDGLFGPRLR